MLKTISLIWNQREWGASGKERWWEWAKGKHFKIQLPANWQEAETGMRRWFLRGQGSPSAWDLDFCGCSVTSQQHHLEACSHPSHKRNKRGVRLSIYRRWAMARPLLPWCMHRSVASYRKSVQGLLPIATEQWLQSLSGGVVKTCFRSWDLPAQLPQTFKSVYPFHAFYWTPALPRALC